MSLLSMLKHSLKLLYKINQPRHVSIPDETFIQSRIISVVGNLNSASKDVGHSEMSKKQKLEVVHHSSFAKDWWNIQGPMKGLHSLNTIRVPFIRDGLLTRCGRDKLCDNIYTTNVLKGQKILEVGCGGGILTEPLARLGAEMTALDLSDDLILAAREHLECESKELLERITYKAIPVEVFAKDHSCCYDAVVLSEVIEHVADKVSFLTACVNCLKPGGSLFITTLNKTLLMWVSAVLVAEYVMNFIPKGTHHWDLMISPLELQRILDTMDCETVIVNGSIYNPLTKNWSWINSTNFAYSMQAIKVEN